MRLRLRHAQVHFGLQSQAGLFQFGVLRMGRHTDRLAYHQHGPRKGLGTSK